MSEVTLQSVFNRVAAHLLRQGEKSESAHGCAYRDEHNRNCAVGCLITDEHYQSSLEGETIRDIRVEIAVTRSLGLEALSVELGELLGVLQEVHDDFNPDQWFERLKDVTTRFDLDWPKELENAS